MTPPSRRKLVLTGLVTVGLVLGVFATALLLAGEVLVATGRAHLKPHKRLVTAVSKPRRRSPLAILVGDSTFGLRPEKRSYTRLLVRRFGDRAELRAIWAVGMGPVEHYLLLGPALAHAPEVVVVLAHLRMLWGSEPLWYPALLPLLPPAELPRALALPFHARGVGAGRLVMASAFGALRHDDWMYAFVGGVELARRSAGLRWLAPASGGGVSVVAPAEAGATRPVRYGEPLHRGHPALAMIAASVEMAERRGARTLVLVSPVPVDRLREVGVYRAAAVEHRVALVTEVARRNGAEVLDLHQALDPADFSDGLGHYSESGAKRVADALEPWLQEALGLPAEPGIRRARRP